MSQRQPWQMLLHPLLLLHTVILTASPLPQTHTSQVSPSLSPASISPLASSWLGIQSGQGELQTGIMGKAERGLLGA